MQDIRARSLYSLFYFSKVVLGYPHMVPHLHGKHSEWFLTNWEEGITKQGIEFPRGFFKTSLFTIGGSIWSILPHNDEDAAYAIAHLEGMTEEKWFRRMKLHDQDARQILAFETMDNASRMVQRIKLHFEENDLFRAAFPEIAYQGKEAPWNNMSLRIRRVGFAKRETEGTFDAIGVGGALQSRHYDRAWEDDLVGEKARDTRSVMEDTIGWHQRLAGAFNRGVDQTRFLISNRWGYMDLNSHIREHEKDWDWHTVAAMELDSDTGELVSTFPEEYPMSKLLALKESMTDINFNCQYMNSPHMPGEDEVGPKLHFYTVDRERGRLVCSCGASWSPRQMLRYMNYDPYQSRNTSVSCPALVVTGTTADKHIILLQTWTHRGSYAEVFDQMWRMNDAWKPHYFSYEDVGSQNMTEEYIRKAQSEATFNDKYKTKIVNIQRDKPGGKAMELRVRDHLFPVLRGVSGTFACHRNHQAFLQQLQTFPFPHHAHDYDILDALAYAARRWRFPLPDEALPLIEQADSAAIAAYSKPYSHMETFTS
jgi:hypothetical protein